MSNLNANVKIDIGKFSEDFRKEINRKLPQAEEASALTIEREVKKAFTTFPKPPIQTGNLRRNIKASKLSDGSWEVRASTPLVMTGKGKNKKARGGKEVEYASFVEFGTVKMAPRPFFRTGIENALPKIEKIIERIFKF